MLYNKIYTLFERETGNGKKKVIPILNKSKNIQALNLINYIIVEEKINGTNSCLQIEYNSNNRISYQYFSRNNNISNQIDYKDIMFIRETIDKVVNFRIIKEWYLKYFVHKGYVRFPIVRIFGETYGSKIQKSNYLSKGERSFIVFDIRIANSWLSVEDRNSVAKELNLKTVPIVCKLFRFPTFEECYQLLFKTYSKSVIAKENNLNMFLEGFILRPKISIYINNNNNRILGKIKRKDFI